MAIRVIVELQAKLDKRSELNHLLESVAATLGPRLPGFLGSTRFEVLDNPDLLVEIADWTSAEVRGRGDARGNGFRSLRIAGGIVGRALQGNRHQPTLLKHSLSQR
jgi:hypothetical protein